jgi:hypothetical protein
LPTFFSASTAFIFGAIYLDKTATFKWKKCTRKTNEVILNVHIISISISISASTSDSTVALFGSREESSFLSHDEGKYVLILGVYIK